jgi:thiol-disulfide isomerase/thioredoxin
LVAGGTWTSESARGQVLVIDVWATWCKPCSKGFPKLDALAARRTDIAVVAITIDEDPGAIRHFLAEFPLAVPAAHDAKQELTRPPLNIARLPTVLIVDAGGVIRRRLEEPAEADYDRLDELASAVQR